MNYAPVALKDAKIVIACSNKKRGLGDSKYNERRSECEEALADIRKHMDIKSLGDLTEEQFEEAKKYITREVCVQTCQTCGYGKPAYHKSGCGSEGK